MQLGSAQLAQITALMIWNEDKLYKYSDNLSEFQAKFLMGIEPTASSARVTAKGIKQRQCFEQGCNVRVMHVQKSRKIHNRLIVRVWKSLALTKCA